MPLTRLPLTTGVSGTLAAGNGGTGVTSVDSIGNLVKVATATFSADASVEFTSLSDYDYYEFHFYNMKPTTDGNNTLLLSASTDGTNYNTGIYQASIISYNKNDGTAGGGAFANSAFATENDTNGVLISERFGSGTGESQDGKISLYQPSSTSKYKYYQTQYSGYHSEDYAWGALNQGYIGTTSALAGIKISIGSGTIAEGTVVQYGLRV